MIKLKQVQCSWKEPVQVVKCLSQTWGAEGLIWLDGDGSKLGRWAILATNPVEEICCRGLPKDKDALNPFESLRNLPKGHWTGWLSYEAGAWVEPMNNWQADGMATLWMASHDPIIKFDLQKQELWIEGCDEKRIDEMEHWLHEIPSERNSSDIKPTLSSNSNNQLIPIDSWEWLTDSSEFSRDVRSIKELISKGDIFQANLSACCITKLPEGVDALDIYQRLRVHCPAPFSGIIIGGTLAKEEAIISASPERFLNVLPSGKIETRPIKGTRPRDKNPKADANNAAELITSIKDRAENIMIVDLLRNDLGKVCRPGSISVPELLRLESYKHVHHLTSVVNGSLKTNKTWVDLLESCWPGGSITGAPKLRACQRLEELEPVARGPYCGSLLRRTWDGTFDSNILIRSFMLQGASLRAHAGCGIVADSDPIKEAEELKWKLLPLLKALQ